MPVTPLSERKSSGKWDRKKMGTAPEESPNFLTGNQEVGILKRPA
jgi:hypothetical protein